MKRFVSGLRTLMFGLCVALVAGTAHAQAGDPLEGLVGKPVSSITIDVEGVADTTPALAALIDINRGTPLILDTVRDGIRHLFRAGYTTESVVGTLGPSGVDLVFNVKPAHPVEDLQFQGFSTLSPGELSRSVRQRFGPALETTPPEAVEAYVKELLYREGYLIANPKVNPRESHAPHKTTYVVDLNPGPQAKIGRVTIVGHPAPFTEEEVRHQTKTEPGAVYQPRVLEDELVKLRDKLRGLRRYAANAVVAKAEPREGSKFVDLILTVESGPLVRDIVWAGDPRPAGNVDDLVPIKRENAIDADLLDAADRTIENELKKDGYKEAKVVHASSPDGDELTITFTVTRGLKYTVGKISIEGSQGVAKGTLLEAMQQADVASGLPFIDGRVHNAENRILLTYRVAGYYKAAVSVTFSDRPEGTEGRGLTDLMVSITEGPQAIIADIVFRRTTSLVSDDDLLKVLKVLANVKGSGDVGLVKGGPYFEALPLADLTLTSLYADRGFPRADIKATASGDETRKIITFEIVEGPQFVVDDISVVGTNEKTAGEIRQAMTLHRGDPIGASAIQQNRRIISNSNLFSNVEITVEPPAPGTTRSHVIVTVAEQALNTLGYGGGVEAGRRLRPLAGGGTEPYIFVGPRGFFEYTRLNFGGIHRSLDLYARLSMSPNIAGTGFGFSEYRLSGRLVDHEAFRTDSEASVGLALEQGIRPDFRYIRKGINADITHQLRREHMTVFGRYSLDFNKLLDQQISEQERPLIDRLFSQVRTSMFTGGFLWDRRNDPLTPTSGTLVSVDGGVAARAFGSELGFVRSLLQGSYYRSLTGGKGLVSAFRVMTGFAHGYPRVVTRHDDAGNPFQETVADVPAGYRFFAGGSTTVRAFTLDSLGVRSIIDDNGLSAGGNGMLIMNAEFRARVAKLLNRDFGVVGFIDAGNVFANASDISFSPMRAGVGFGIRYDSKFGPLRLDFGFKLDRLTIAGKLEPRWAWHLSLGEAF